MKKLLIFALVALMAMSLAGCWNVYLLEPPSPSAAETTMPSNRPIESAEPTPTTKAVAYPGKIATTMSWKQETKDGFIVSTDVQVWDPVKLDRDFAHPADSVHTIEVYDQSTHLGNLEFKEREVWVFAFCVTLENHTIDSERMVFSIVYGVDYIAKDQSYIQADLGYREEFHYLVSGDFYFKCNDSFRGSFSSLGLGSGMYCGGTGDSIPSPGRIRACGYVLFLDAESTQERPDGATREDLGYNQDSQLAFGVSRVNLDLEGLQPIVSFTKDNNGNFVFDKKYSLVMDNRLIYD